METEIVIVDTPVPRDFVYNDYYPIENSQISLANKDLWNQFYASGTEMIITKTGRRMFPSLNVKINNLDPNADYCLFLEMNLANRCRYKFSSSGGWSPAGHEEGQSPHRLYMHPESPSKGAHWMSQTVNFFRAKLTNTSSPPPGQIVLTSMHKYQPKILLVKTSNPQILGWAPSKCFVFPETQFIAVTAYQNEKITKLKINHNPFAKGFRENGKSNSKRKQIAIEEPNSPGSKKSTTPSPPPEPDMSENQRLLLRRDAVSVMPVYSRYYYPAFSLYHGQWTGTTPACCQYPFRIPEFELVKQYQMKKTKKLTDFSIDAIMNS